MDTLSMWSVVQFVWGGWMGIHCLFSSRPASSDVLLLFFLVAGVLSVCSCCLFDFGFFWCCYLFVCFFRGSFGGALGCWLLALLLGWGLILRVFWASSDGSSDVSCTIILFRYLYIYICHSKKKLAHMYREKLVRREELLILCAHYPTNSSKLVIVKSRWILRIYNMVIIYIYIYISKN